MHGSVEWKLQSELFQEFPPSGMQVALAWLNFTPRGHPEDKGSAFPFRDKSDQQDLITLVEEKDTG
jgi:hypothetical protein